MQIKQDEYLYRKAFPKGQLIAVVGEANAGKTLIMEYVCGKVKEQRTDMDIAYINIDIAASQLPRAERLVREGGYRLICPDAKPGVSVEMVLNLLYAYAESDQDLSNVMIVIDTLKKLVDIINKHEARKLYAMLRKLTGRGASVICLAHTNKYQQESDGEKWPMYEGTGDIRTDFDAMFLLDSHNGDYGLITSSMYWKEQGCPWSKERSIVEPLSWTIDKHGNLEITQLGGWVDTRELKKEQAEVKKVAHLIQDVHSLLTGTPGQQLTRTVIVEKMKGRHSQRQLDRHLPAYVGKAWTVEKGERNADVYQPIAGFRTWGD